jgi:rubrerythrin
MDEEKSLSEIIRMAVLREQDAYFFYWDLLESAKDESVKDTLRWIADEEKKHRKFLIDYQSGKFGDKALRMSTVVDYKVADTLKAPENHPAMDSADIFLTAAHRELKSWQFYTDLAGIHSDLEIKELLIRMANEELKHKEKMEYLYTNTAFAQTSGG